MSLQKMALSLAVAPPVEKLFSAFSPRAVILMYHRVLPGEMSDVLDRGLCVTRKRFEEHIRLIAEHYHFLRLDDLPAHLNSTDPMGVVITFDDGYRDTLEYALPILERYDAPATVFVSTRYPDGDCRVWWLELEELLREYAYLRFFWRDRRLDLRMENKNEKAAAFTVLRDLLLDGLAPEEQEQLLHMLRQGRPARNYADLFMDWTMLRELAAHPCITIGAHTVGHVNLAALAPDRARAEIAGGKQRLEAMLQCEIRHLAYPYGSLREAGPREYAMAQEFVSAVTTMPGVIRAGVPLHALARLTASQKDDLTRLRCKLGGLFALRADLRKRFSPA